MNAVILEDMEKIFKKLPLDHFDGKTFFITGASGLLGTYFFHSLIYFNEYCAKEKCKIVALCRNEKKAHCVFREYLGRDDFELIIHDLNEPIFYEDKIDYIIHAASIANTSSFFKDPVGTILPNSVGTIHLLELAKEKLVQSFLFFSSGAVYGQIPDGVSGVNETDSFSLDYSFIGNCYAESKRFGETACLAYEKQYSVPVKIVRIAHTYGPGINLDDGRVFSDFIRSILKEEDLLIKGSGRDLRYFCYLSDALFAFYLILYSSSSGEIYNMANNDCGVTISELARILVEDAFSEKNLKVQYHDRSQMSAAIIYEDKSVYLETQKLKKLGWEPETSVVQGFQRTVKSILLEEK